MLPKIIHYCWFGSNPIPELEKKCIESWKKTFPEFKLMFWNEETFDINSCLFTKIAYEHAQYAFVSDYVRVKALYDFGGIYVDTDYEFIKNICDIIEKYDNILGWENKYYIGTAFMAFTPKHEIIEYLLDYYNKSNLRKNEIDTTANVAILTNLLTKYGLKIDKTRQVILNIQIFERDYFYPKKNNNNFDISQNTCGVHHYSMSWLSERQKKRGNNFFWRKIIRPILKRCQVIANKLIGYKRIKPFEIWIRKKLR